MRKSQYFPFSMLSAKQGNYWYHFYNVFGLTRSLTGDWTRNLPHSNQHYTTRLSRRRYLITVKTNIIHRQPLNNDNALTHKNTHPWYNWCTRACSLTRDSFSKDNKYIIHKWMNKVWMVSLNGQFILISATV